MSFHRRDFLTGTAAIAAGMTAALVGTRRAEAGDPSVMNNVPDPLISAKQLPTFEFGPFSITDWLGHTPKALLAKNFGLPESTFDGFPEKEVYFAQGALPPEKRATPLQGVKAPSETHKYRLLANPPHVNNKGGRLWLVDSTKFPISKTFAGAILELDLGAMRELHWHPTADEWHYVLKGTVSVTMFGSGGRHKIETLEKGDVRYIPHGYGHSIENVGAGLHPALLAFNPASHQ